MDRSHAQAGLVQIRHIERRGLWLWRAIDQRDGVHGAVGLGPSPYVDANARVVDRLAVLSSEFAGTPLFAALVWPDLQSIAQRLSRPVGTVDTLRSVLCLLRSYAGILDCLELGLCRRRGFLRPGWRGCGRSFSRDRK